jgi:SAM-dependent methyltransferase
MTTATQHPGDCARSRGKPCRLCELAETDPRYAQHWRGLAAPATAAATGLVRQCIPCGGNVRIKNAAPDLLPGLQDPLPVPEAAAIPAGWPRRPDVRKKHVAALRWLAAAPLPPPAVAEGDGVVVCGGGRYWPMVTVCVRMVRDVCDLPVQVWHRGAQEPIDPVDLVDVPGVTFHDATQIPVRILREWQTKLVALLHCGLRRVLFLDADAYPVADPRPLLELAMAARPFVFWSDLPNRDNDVKWPAFGFDVAPPIPGVQGGQLAIDRVAFWRELILAHWLVQHADYTYSGRTQREWQMYGDQDAWRVALALTGTGYHHLGRAPWQGTGWSRGAFVAALDGAPMVCHRCQAKWFAEPGDHRSDLLPAEARAWQHRERFLAPAGADAAAVFGRIYRRGLWGHGDASGGGSTAREAPPYLELVRGLLRLAGARRVVDLGCGDGAVTRQLGAAELIGVDCYAPHLDRLRREVPGIHWWHLDLDRDRDRLPAADVALLKDTLHHWPDALVRDWLTWARGAGKWRWLVLTYDCAHAATGADCRLGGYRPLDAGLPPLAGTGAVRLTRYLHKEVALLQCDAP